VVRSTLVWFSAAALISAVCLLAPGAAAQSNDDSEARPPVSKADIEIVKRARAILDSPSKWNRADNRVCPADAKTFSLYCALEKATDEVSGNFEHRGAAMQEARFVIDALKPNANYDHRLMGYNNDPSTTFADIQKVLDLLERNITKRLAEEGSNAPTSAGKPVPGSGAPQADSSVTKTDIQVIQRARAILDSQSKWNRDRTQTCPPDAKTFNLYCALAEADKEVTGKFDKSCPAMREARNVIDEVTPSGKNYDARLVDYNADPAISFADIQKLLRLVEERLTKQLAQQAGK